MPWLIAIVLGVDVDRLGDVERRVLLDRDVADEARGCALPPSAGAGAARAAARAASARQQRRIASGRRAVERYLGRALDRWIVVLVERLLGEAQRPRDQHRREALDRACSGRGRWHCNSAARSAARVSMSASSSCSWRKFSLALKLGIGLGDREQPARAGRSSVASACGGRRDAARRRSSPRAPR